MFEIGMKEVALSTAMGVAALALAMPAGAGSADGIVTIENVIEPSQPRFSWAGTYAGAQVNWFHVIDGPTTRDGTGVMGGVHAGVRGDLGIYTIGFEIEANALPISLASGDTVDAYFAGKIKFGVPFGRFHMSAAFAPTVYTGSLGTSTGLAYGGGIDYMFNDKWIMGVEYLSHSISGFGTPVGVAPGGDRAVAGSVSFRASYKF